MNRPRKEEPMDAFFSFRRMITPVIIRILFWVGIFGSIIGGIYLIVVSEGAAARIAGIFWIILGPLVSRVICELFILQFRIYETLTDIKNNTQQK
jgi:hypothetical protein